MAAQNDDLFLLIKSLSRTEKGYFKKLFSGKDKDFIKLFDLLDKMKEYDEEKLRKAFQAKQTNLSVLKAYLVEQILKSLRLYHLSLSREFELLGQIQELHLLKSKKLDHLLHKRMEKARKDTDAIGSLALENYLHYFENFTRNTAAQPDLFRPWPEIQKDLVLNTKDIEERLELYSLYREVEKKYREKIGFGSASNKSTEKFRNHPLLDLNYPIHFGTDIPRHYVHSMLCLMENDLEGSYRHHLANLAIYKSHPEYAANNITGYLGLHDSTIRMACGMNKYDEAEKLLQSLDEIKPTNEFDHDWNRSIHYEVALTRAVDSRQFNLSPKQLEEISAFYWAHGEIPTPMQYARLIISFYTLKNWSGAIDWANTIVEMKDPQRQYDFLQVLARCLLMIFYFEQDNSSLLESQLHSAQFYFKTHGIESELCSAIGNGLLKVQHEPGKKEKKLQLEKLRDKIKRIPDASSNDPQLRMFDFVEWCNNRLK